MNSTMDQMQTFPPGHRVNEAALFVENNMTLPQETNVPVYDDFLDQFVTKEISQQQYAIR